MAGLPWKVSLHGGHSGAYCDHATGTLREVLDAAVAVGYHTFGVSEHAPRLGEQFLYDTEKAMGWDVAKLEADFDAYARELPELARAYEGRLTVLRGFEIEVIPADRYVEVMRGYRERYGFDYIVGSVHFLHDIPIDGPREAFERVVELEGGLEAVGRAYYRKVAEMAEALRPEVVGHLDLIRKNAPSNESVETAGLKRAAGEALEVIRETGGILDVNTAGYRKGLGSPYPAPWLLRLANEMGIGVCFGDDSHGPEDVGAGIDEARGYLLEHGVEHVTVLTREEGAVVKKRAALDP